MVFSEIAQHNDNDNDISLKEKYNDNVNDRSRAAVKAARVDSIAGCLVQKFNAPKSRNFFCKCAWKLSENEIWAIYEKAHQKNIKAPIKYFVALCKIQMEK